MMRSDIASSGPGTCAVLKQAAAEQGSLDSSTTGDDKHVSVLQLQLFCQVSDAGITMNL
jgi:hypothetical protein